MFMGYARICALDTLARCHPLAGGGFGLAQAGAIGEHDVGVAAGTALRDRTPPPRHTRLSSKSGRTDLTRGMLLCTRGRPEVLGYSASWPCSSPRRCCSVPAMASQSAKSAASSAPGDCVAAGLRHEDGQLHRFRETAREISAQPLQRGELDASWSMCCRRGRLRGAGVRRASAPASGSACCDSRATASEPARTRF